MLRLCLRPAKAPKTKALFCTVEKPKLPFLHKWRPAYLVAGADYNRYKQIPASLINHLCLGSVFAWSVLNDPLTRHHGVVAPSSEDWTTVEATRLFPLIMGGFAWGAWFGRYFDRFGPRICCLLGATCLGTGFGMAASAVHIHNIWLYYGGGMVWGMANGWAYVPPVVNLVRWFPERRGFASGACILGYGGAATLAAPLITGLVDHFRIAPQYVGSHESVAIIPVDGVINASVMGELKAVVYATASSAKKFNVEEGWYVVDTGSTGLVPALLTVGGLYSATMIACSFFYRVAPPNYVPPHLTSVPSAVAQLTNHDVSLPVAMRTPQFWLTWFGFGCSVTGAYSILAFGNTMMSEVFGAAMPSVVTPSACITFVSALAIANLVGRLIWPNVSDVLVRWVGGDPVYGRRLTFSIMFGLGPALYYGLLWGIHNSFGTDSYVPLAVFSGCAFTIMASFGGTSSTRPAFAADLYGNKAVGEITARSLTAVLPAAWAGSQLAAHFREEAITKSIHDLAGRVPDDVFFRVFATGKDQLDLLITQKTITIARLLELLPADTVNPIIYAYDSTFYTMMALQAIAFLSNILVTPIPVSKHVQKSEEVTKI